MIHVYIYIYICARGLSCLVTSFGRYSISMQNTYGLTDVEMPAYFTRVNFAKAF